MQALLADAGLAAIVGTRITWERRKEGTPLPAIVLHLINANERYSMTRRLTFTDAIVQADLETAGFLEGVLLERAWLAATDTLKTKPLQVFPEARRGSVEAAEDPDPVTGSTDAYQRQVDNRVWHERAA